MIPTEEIEHLIHKSITHELNAKKTHPVTSFPEIELLKLESCYAIMIIENHQQDYKVIKRYRELEIDLKSRKITIENKILDKNRKISVGVFQLKLSVPIYYKNCIFTDQHILFNDYCENCIT